jgi:hypothetical protein
MEMDSLWRSAFGDTTRPVLYASEELNEDGFLPLNEPQRFLMNFPNPKRKQLYAASANNQIAMKLAQDEYLDLERQIAHIKGKETFKDPRTLPAPDVFEERKEAALYGYKYEPNKPALLQAGIPGLRSGDDLTDREKHDVRLFQEPFEQGGFVPKEKEYKAMLAKARNPKNIDGWIPIKKNGKSLIPRQQLHHDEYSMTYVKRNVDENGEVIRPQSVGSEASGETPSKAVDKRLTRTRFDGKKVPPTRDVSETPSGISTPSRKRANTPVPDDREDTPSKRRKPNGVVAPVPDRPKHPNQWTKAKQLAIDTNVAQPIAKVGGAKSSWQGLSPTSLRNRKWTDEELMAAVKHDHLWLHDDPVKAEDWKHKIINGVNPVRSFSMFRKWAYWKVENKDKRPRAKKNLPEEGQEASQDPDPSSKPKSTMSKPQKPSEGGRTTPSMPSGPETMNGGGVGMSPETKRGSVTRSGGSNKRSGIKLIMNNHVAEEDELHRGTETEVGSRVEDYESSQQTVELNSSPSSRPGMKMEESDSITAVHVHNTPSTRRSLRNLRRASG